MPDIQFIASDIDGTLLPSGGYLSDALKDAVAACRRRGIPFVLASGRWLGAMAEIRGELGLEDQPMIVANGGAALSAEGEPLREWTMSPALARAVYEKLRGRDVMVNSYIRNGLYRLNTALHPGRRRALAPGLRQVEDDPDAFEAEALSGVYKLEVYSDDPARLAAIRADVAALGVSVTSAFHTNLEIMAPGAGKGAAVEWLASRLGVPRENRMALGDNTNDLDMLRAAAWSVAMGGGAQALKDEARILAPRAEDDGAAWALQTCALGGQAAGKTSCGGEER